MSAQHFTLRVTTKETTSFFESLSLPLPSFCVCHFSIFQVRSVSQLKRELTGTSFTFYLESDSSNVPGETKQSKLRAKKESKVNNPKSDVAGKLIKEPLARTGPPVMNGFHPNLKSIKSDRVAEDVNRGEF